MFADFYLKRKKVFDSIDYHLNELKKLINDYDSNSDIYLFGSVLKGNYNMGSDIDILIVTAKKAGIMKLLWDNNYDEPLEFHINIEEEAKVYFRHIMEIKKIN